MLAFQSVKSTLTNMKTQRLARGLDWMICMCVNGLLKLLCTFRLQYLIAEADAKESDLRGVLGDAQIVAYRGLLQRIASSICCQVSTLYWTFIM